MTNIVHQIHVLQCTYLCLDLELCVGVRHAYNHNTVLILCPFTLLIVNNTQYSFSSQLFNHVWSGHTES